VHIERLIAELRSEGAATRRVLERVPAGKFSWTPHEKSMTLGVLAMHVATVPRGLARLLSDDVAELPFVPRPEATSIEELLVTLDESVAFAAQKLEEWGDARLEAPWTMQREGRTLLQLPRGAMVRSTMLNHWYHHRGQLTVYLRLLDVPLPSIYGPSADENPFG
jgi:uncharacterized damage-inducible protein DinB